MEESTDIGPLATTEAAQDLSRQIADAQQKGATVVDGPSVPTRGGFFRPGVILRARQDMLIAQEETFGPIAPIFEAENDKELLDLANATKFGLGGPSAGLPFTAFH